MPNQTDRRDYDTGASQSAQDNFNVIAQRLESLIDQRDADVRAAMADYAADGVSDAYQAVELRWKRAAAETRHIIATLRAALTDSDQTATATLSKAKAAVDAIG